MTSPWATPGSAPPQPAAPSADEPVVAAPGAVPDDDDHLDRPLPPPPVPLRPMTIPDLLDGSFAVLKRRPREVLTLSAAFVVPIQLVSAVLLRDVLGAGGFLGTGIGDPTTTVGVEDSGEITGLGATVTSAMIALVSLALLTGALAGMVADWYDGVRRPPLAMIRSTLRRAPALIVGVVVVHLLEFVGLIGVFIGSYVLMGLLHLVSPIIVAESVGPFRAIRRSMQLTGSKFWRSMGLPLLVGLIGAIVGFGFQLIPELVTLVVSDDWNWLIRTSGATLAQLVAAPFTAGVAVLYHLDLRTRSEGYDISRRVRERQDERAS